MFRSTRIDAAAALIVGVLSGVAIDLIARYFQLRRSGPLTRRLPRVPHTAVEETTAPLGEV